MAASALRRAPAPAPRPTFLQEAKARLAPVLPALTGHDIGSHSYRPGETYGASFRTEAAARRGLILLSGLLAGATVAQGRYGWKVEGTVVGNWPR